MDNITLLVVLAVLALLGIGTTVFFFMKISKEKKYSMEVMLLYFKDMIIIAQQAIEIVEVNKSNYETEKDYFKALARMIADDIKRFLRDKTSIDNKIIESLDDEVLLEMAYNAIKFIQDKAVPNKVDGLDEVVENNNVD